MPESLALLRELVEAEKVECPNCNGTGHIFTSRKGDPRYDDSCGPCRGTGQVPNPRFKGLREVLWEECSGWPHQGGRRTKVSALIDSFPCQKCGGDGKHPGLVPRNWEGLPIGYVVALLLRAARETGLILDDRIKSLLCLCFVTPEANEAVTQVVIEAMGKLNKEEK